MRKKSLIFRSCSFAQLFVIIFFIGFTNAVAAQSSEVRSTIVFVSMAKQSGLFFWPEGEERIEDELRLSNLDVTMVDTAATAESDEFAELNLHAELKSAAKSDSVMASILIYKKDRHNFHLLLYTKNRYDGSYMYKEYAFLLSSAQEEEEADIAAFKVAEVIQLLLTRDTPPPLISPQKKNRPPLSTRLRAVLTFAITGAVTVGLGGLFHWRKTVYEKKATDISNEMRRDENVGYYVEVAEQSPDFEQNDNKEKRYRAAMIVSYSVGSALIAAASVVFFFKKDKLVPTPSTMLSLRGSHIVWEF